MTQSKMIMNPDTFHCYQWLIDVSEIRTDALTVMTLKQYELDFVRDAGDCLTDVREDFLGLLAERILEEIHDYLSDRSLVAVSECYLASASSNGWICREENGCNLESTSASLILPLAAKSLRNICYKSIAKAIVDLYGREKVDSTLIELLHRPSDTKVY